MKTMRHQAWAVIPARGGSVSIPLKNLAIVHGRPLLDYVIRAAQASRQLSRILCSTDHDRIALVCREQGVDVHPRPQELSGPTTPIVEVLTHVVRDLGEREGAVAEMLCLLQPTSPFVRPEDIDGAIEMLRRDPQADSVQTVTTLPHNFHAYNQRVVEDGTVRFLFPEQRRACYNKQTKPPVYRFGNMIVTRTRSLMEQGDLFGRCSLAAMIEPAYATDVDTPHDLEWAEWLLSTGNVVLGHLEKPVPR